MLAVFENRIQPTIAAAGKPTC